MEWKPFSLVILFTVLIIVAGLANNMPALGQSPAQQSTDVQGVFLAFHLEVSTPPRIHSLWPSLVDFVALADTYGAKVSLQFSEPWARYVYDNDLTATVQAWEANGHEIALHHHGPTHKFFDWYTNRPDLIRTDGWYATDGTYQGDMAALMTFPDPLAVNPIVSAGMSDADIDWPAGVLYYATKTGETSAKTDLLSVPVQATYNGYTVTKVTNAGYAIDHLGDAAVTLADIEQGLQNATPDQVMGIVVNDDTIENHFDEIEPLFQLLQQYALQVRTTRDVVENYQPVGTPTATPTMIPTVTPTEPATTPTATPTPQPFTLIPDATYGQSGDVRYVRIPATDCANLTASPIVVGDWLVYPNHEHSRNCSDHGPYRNALFGYNLRDGRLYLLRDDGSGEAPLLYQPDQGRLYWTTTFGGTVSLLDAESFALRGKVSLQVVSDSSGVFLDGLYYFGTVNTPEDNCQNPINENCGAVFAIDAQGNGVHRLNIDDGFRAWIGTSLTTDGQYLYIGSAKQTKGQEGVEAEYLYGCSVTKADKQLNILASFDPGDFGCYYQPYVGANADSVAGEVVPDGSGLWVQYVRPNDDRSKVALYRLDLNLQEQCRMEFDFVPQTQAVGFYGAPTVDSEGNAYVSVSVPDAQATRKGQLWKVTPTCQATLLREAPGSFAHASPTLADVPPAGGATGGYVLFATDGKLQILTLAGDLVHEYALASDARVLASPLIHDGVVYVVQEDGTLNIIEDAGVTGYGDAIWPRYRHDNQGSGALETAPTPTATPTLPASQCVRDANQNGIGDVVDIMATASELPCLVYLPLVVAHWRQPWPTPTSARYPRLHANLFSKVPENEAAYDALSRYGAVTTGALHSVGSEGGYDLGVRQGVGSWADTTYDLMHAGRGAISQVTVYEAKKRNPELTMFAHRGLKHIPALYFGYSTNSPQRWFIDRLSPRWFAYTPLIELQEPVTRTSQLTFRFRPEDVQQWRN